MMLIAWMGYATLLTTAICLAAFAAERVVMIWGGPQRLVWLGVVLTSVILPVTLATAAASLPRVSTVDVSSRTLPWSGGEARDSQRASTLARASAAVQAPMAKVTNSGAHFAALSDTYVRTAWPLTSVILLVLFFGANARLRYRRTQWCELVVDGMRVLVAPELGPAVIGALRPRVVIPRWSLSLDPHARGLMLRHEAEHIEAHDPRLLLLAALCLVLVPWNLALWIAVRRLRSAIEIDCDRRVLRLVPEPRVYGSLLIAVSARVAMTVPFAPALVERRSLLERRIRAMTAAPPRRPVVWSLLFGAMTLIATSGAARAPHPQPLRQRVLRALDTARFNRRATVARGDTVIVRESAPGTPASLGAIPRRSGRLVRAASAQTQVASPSLGREVWGTVRAADTYEPLRDVEVGTVGVQLIGAPNVTCTNEQGEFRYRVPLGEVRLEARHLDYEFGLVTVGANDSTAQFMGTRIVRDTTRMLRDTTTYRSLVGVKGIWMRVLQPVLIIDGKPVPSGPLRVLGGPLRCNG
jgi:beta-lactamase regulating signal transducer with metallopeptidase domain